MKEEFQEGLQSERADPMDAQVCDFPYDQIDLPESVQPIYEEKLKQTLTRVLQFAIDDHETMSQQSVGRRFIGLAWVLDPSLFPGTPSLRTLAKRLSMDVSGLSRVAAQASREFGIKNRAQAHGDGVRK